jgi:hypothetical protein
VAGVSCKVRSADGCALRRPHQIRLQRHSSCDSRCSRAGGTDAELGNLARFLTYHEHHGNRAEARRLYAGLNPSARDWGSPDLEAARRACPNHLDFARLLPRADEHLGGSAKLQSSRDAGRPPGVACELVAAANECGVLGDTKDERPLVA